ncbi:unnamed protein product [Acanthosepion pharaonis]|uniref:Uncharacterized protein n=1 Tax=Acanthosepion pharaonis TaxID=158019 RepID=A0A812BG69_ACAPH|nr:unnamed protein product [Sepia pharaonis]
MPPTSLRLPPTSTWSRVRSWPPSMSPTNLWWLPGCQSAVDCYRLGRARINSASLLLLAHIFFFLTYPLSRGPVRSRGGKWHVFSLDSREASHRPPRRSFFMKELPVSYAEETGTPRVASLTTASSPRLQNVDYGHAQTATVVAPSFRSRRSKYKPWASRSQSVPPPPPYSAVTVRGRVLLSYLKHRRPRLGRDDPLNLSISLSGGKETNRDSLIRSSLDRGRPRRVPGPFGADGERRPSIRESGCLGTQPKSGGKLHPRLNTGTSPIVDKYRVNGWDRSPRSRGTQSGAAERGPNSIWLLPGLRSGGGAHLRPARTSFWGSPAGNAVCRQLCRRQLDLDALRILLLRSRRRRERRAAGNEESAAVAAVAAAAAVAAIRVAAAAAAAVAAVAAVVAPPLHSSRSPAPFLRSASYGAGASARRSHSARPAPDALPLRSVVATRSRRAGRRAVSVGGRRTLNSTPPACRGGRRRLLSGPRAYCPFCRGRRKRKRDPLHVANRFLLVGRSARRFARPRRPTVSGARGTVFAGASKPARPRRFPCRRATSSRRVVFSASGRQNLGAREGTASAVGRRLTVPPVTRVRDVHRQPTRPVLKHGPRSPGRSRVVGAPKNPEGAAKARERVGGTGSGRGVAAKAVPAGSFSLPSACLAVPDSAGACRLRPVVRFPLFFRPSRIGSSTIFPSPGDDAGGSGACGGGKLTGFVRGGVQPQTFLPPPTGEIPRLELVTI